MVLLTLVALGANHTRSAEALSCEDVTGGVVRALRVAVAILAPLPAADVPVPVSARIAILSNNVGFAFAFAGVGVTDW